MSRKVLFHLLLRNIEIYKEVMQYIPLTLKARKSQKMRYEPKYFELTGTRGGIMFGIEWSIKRLKTWCIIYQSQYKLEIELTRLTTLQSNLLHRQKDNQVLRTGIGGDTAQFLTGTSSTSIGLLAS